jgi:hypothetical protein
MELASSLHRLTGKQGQAGTSWSRAKAGCLHTQNTPPLITDTSPVAAPLFLITGHPE